MRYQWHGETLVTDLVSALAAAAYGGLRAAYAINASAETDASKRKGKLKLGVLADAVVGAGGLIAKNYVGGALAHETLEALGHAGFASLGMWAGAVYKKSDNIPVWKPEEKQQSAQSYYVYQEPAAYYGPAPSAAPVGAGNASILEI